jgi:hypothetical protein
MESIKSQAEVLKRVVGEAQDANLEELSAGLVPAIQQLDGLEAGKSYQLDFKSLHHTGSLKIALCAHPNLWRLQQVYCAS